MDIGGIHRAFLFLPLRGVIFENGRQRKRSILSFLGKIQLFEICLAPQIYQCRFYIMVRGDT